MKKQNYQGDVGIISGAELPKNIKLSALPKEGLVIAEGEVTGHKHLIVAEPEAIVEFGQDEKGTYIVNVKSGQAKLTHNKHDVQVLKRGAHFFPMQMEYSEDEDKRVQD